MKAHEAGGTVLGSAALVAGTAIGGGFLGLPYFTFATGFLPSSAALVACWAFLLVQALAVGELCAGTMQKLKTPRTSVFTMARETLGDAAASILGLAFFFLLSSTLVAQVAKAGSMLSLSAAAVTGLPPLPQAAGCAAATAALGALVFFARARVVDAVNEALTLGLFACFGMLAAAAAPGVQAANLLRGSWAPGPLAAATPVLLQLLVYSEIVPTVSSRLGGDVVKIRTALTLGSIVPLAMCIGWNAIALGLVGPAALAAAGGGAGGDPLDVLLTSAAVGSYVRVLALCAVSTTIIGSDLALGLFMDDIFGSGRGGSGIGGTRRWVARALTVLPSLAIATSDPNMFYRATSFAGSYPVTVLWCLAPPAMLWAARYG
ncbi:unnamed protein product, partial [Phaeothamnion confervicola]